MAAAQSSKESDGRSISFRLKPQQEDEEVDFVADTKIQTAGDFASKEDPDKIHSPRKNSAERASRKSVTFGKQPPLDDDEPVSPLEILKHDPEDFKKTPQKRDSLGERGRKVSFGRQQEEIDFVKESAAVSMTDFLATTEPVVSPRRSSVSTPTDASSKSSNSIIDKLIHKNRTSKSRSTPASSPSGSAPSPNKAVSFGKQEDEDLDLEELGEGSDIISFLKTHEPPQKEEPAILSPKKSKSAPSHPEKHHKKDKDKEKPKDKSKDKKDKDRSKDRSKDREERLSQRDSSASKHKRLTSDKELKAPISPEDFLKTDPATPTKKIVSFGKQEENSDDDWVRDGDTEEPKSHWRYFEKGQKGAALTRRRSFSDKDSVQPWQKSLAAMKRRPNDPSSRKESHPPNTVTPGSVSHPGKARPSVRYTDKIVALYMAKEETELSQELHLMRVERDKLENDHAALLAQRIQLSLDRESAMQMAKEKVERDRIETLRARRAALEAKAKTLVAAFSGKTPSDSEKKALAAVQLKLNALSSLPLLERSPILSTEPAQVEEVLKFEKEKALFNIEQKNLQSQRSLKNLSNAELKSLIEAKKEVLIALEAANATGSEEHKLQLYRLRKKRGLKMVDSGKRLTHNKELSGSNQSGDSDALQRSDEHDFQRTNLSINIIGSNEVIDEESEVELATPLQSHRSQQSGSSTPHTPKTGFSGSGGISNRSSRDSDFFIVDKTGRNSPGPHRLPLTRSQNDLAELDSSAQMGQSSPAATPLWSGNARSGSGGVPFQSARTSNPSRPHSSPKPSHSPRPLPSPKLSQSNQSPRLPSSNPSPRPLPSPKSNPSPRAPPSPKSTPNPNYSPRTLTPGTKTLPARPLPPPTTSAPVSKVPPKTHFSFDTQGEGPIISSRKYIYITVAEGSGAGMRIPLPDSYPNLQSTVKKMFDATPEDTLNLFFNGSELIDSTFASVDAGDNIAVSFHSNHGSNLEEVGDLQVRRTRPNLERRLSSNSIVNNLLTRKSQANIPGDLPSVDEKGNS